VVEVVDGAVERLVGLGQVRRHRKRVVEVGERPVRARSRVSRPATASASFSYRRARGIVVTTDAGLFRPTFYAVALAEVVGSVTAQAREHCRERTTSVKH
jgi:hypothetical protein